MKTKVWVLSGVSLFLAVIIAACAYWIDRAVSNQVLVRPSFDAANFVPVTDNAIKNVDLVIAIDNSGSMIVGPATDPNGLRIRAAELVITSLAADIYPRQTSISIVSFGSQSEVLAHLTRLEEPGSRKYLIEQANKTRHDDNTNIIAALDDAYIELFESGNQTKGNAPAIIFLTDGVPTIDTDTNNDLTIPEEVKSRIDKLLSKDVHLFIVLLRGGRNLDENEVFEEWRKYWYQVSFDNSSKFKYYEASQANNLEEIYNDIRDQLDNIGKSSGKIAYDPTNTNEKIIFPPNLLQARLIVRKSDTKVSVEILLPDGTSGEALNNQITKDPSIGDLAGFFKVYTLRQPVAGDWHLRVTPSTTVQYILDFQSIYTAQLLMLKSQDFLNLNNMTTIYADVIDVNSKSAGEGFTLDASLFKEISPAENVFGREEIKLGEFIYDHETEKYFLNIPPEVIPGEGEYSIELKGIRKSDGTIVNMARYKIKAASLPGDARLITPTKVECEDPTPEILNYRFVCSTDIPVKLTIDRPEELSKESLSAKMQAVNDPPVNISEQQISGAAMFGEFEGTYGELPYQGDYTLTSELIGKSTDGFVVVRQARSAVKVVLPDWIPDLQHRLEMAAILLAIIAVWKPVIVWVLSWILLPFNLVPKGKYNSVTTENQSSSSDFRLPNRSISQAARKSRQLFGVRIGPGEPIAIRYPPPVKQTTRPRGWAKKVQNSKSLRWFFDESEYAYWSVRVIPFCGVVLCEDGNETSISEHPPTTTNIGIHTVSFLSGEKPDLMGWLCRLFRK